METKTSAERPSDGSGERVFELQPVEPPGNAEGPRVVGPGRRERSYQAHVARLEGELSVRARELATSERLERGCQRMIDRLERDVAGGRERARLLEQQQKRLILALGAAQREVELLRERAGLAPGSLRARLSRSSDA